MFCLKACFFMKNCSLLRFLIFPKNSQIKKQISNKPIKQFLYISKTAII